MSNINKLFQITPALQSIDKDGDFYEIGSRALKVFEKQMPDFEKVLREAFDAYSTQGFFASPQVNKKNETHQRFFDWSLVNVVRRTDVNPSSHQIVMLYTFEFIIQYLITGGFKNENVKSTNESLVSEFEESKSFIKNIMGIDLPR